MSYRIPLGAWIRRRAKKAELSQLAVADAAGVSEEYIAKIIKQERISLQTYDILPAIAKLLDIPLRLLAESVFYELHHEKRPWLVRLLLRPANDISRKLDALPPANRRKFTLEIEKAYERLVVQEQNEK
jgi:transcriptional regulator with XRE-family HTH domain